MIGVKKEQRFDFSVHNEDISILYCKKRREKKKKRRKVGGKLEKTRIVRDSEGVQF